MTQDNLDCINKIRECTASVIGIIATSEMRDEDRRSALYYLTTISSTLKVIIESKLDKGD